MPIKLQTSQLRKVGYPKFHFFFAPFILTQERTHSFPSLNSLFSNLLFLSIFSRCFCPCHYSLPRVTLAISFESAVNPTCHPHISNMSSVYPPSTPTTSLPYLLSNRCFCPYHCLICPYNPSNAP